MSKTKGAAKTLYKELPAEPSLLDQAIAHTPAAASSSLPDKVEVSLGELKHLKNRRNYEVSTLPAARRVVHVNPLSIRLNSDTDYDTDFNFPTVIVRDQHGRETHCHAIQILNGPITLQPLKKRDGNGASVGLIVYGEIKVFVDPDNREAPEPGCG